jgi:hypothetical protein
MGRQHDKLDAIGLDETFFQSADDFVVAAGER